jgi:hypothetical protein
VTTEKTERSLSSTTTLPPRNLHECVQNLRINIIDNNHVQTSSGAHTYPYPICILALSPGVRRFKRKANQSPPSGSKIQNELCTASMPPAPWTSKHGRFAKAEPYLTGKEICFKYV